MKVKVALFHLAEDESGSAGLRVVKDAIEVSLEAINVSDFEGRIIIKEHISWLITLYISLQLQNRLPN